MELSKKKVFVGVSGGVDSAVSAFLLKQSGYDVTGVFIRTWTPDWMECTWRDERRDAIRVCILLDIPFRELDMITVYKERVAEYMINEYKKGKTPNPDVMCNREVKFGGFLDWALSMGGNFVATGHYAQKNVSLDEKYILLEGADSNKDQTYFLWTLTQKQLAHILFPVGAMQKLDVRKHAEEAQIPVAKKKDSQGICFLGMVNMREFLGHYIAEKQGVVVNTDGSIIGHHPGALFFTLGQRHGFVITEKTSSDLPYFVIHKNIEKNEICVAHRNEQPQTEKGQNGLFHLEQVNCISTEIFPTQCTAKVRYRGEKMTCMFVVQNQSTKKATIQFENPEVLVSSGQSIVFYLQNQCLGGGIVV